MYNHQKDKIWYVCKSKKCGPEIYELYIEDNKVYVSCSDAVKIAFSKNCRRTQKINAPKGEHVNHAVFEIFDTDY